MNKRNYAEALRGAKTMISELLSLSRSDSLLVVGCEDSSQEFEIISDAADKLKVACTCVAVPKRQQAKIQKYGDLPPILRSAMGRADGVLIVQPYQSELTPFRMTLLEHTVEYERNQRAASMPDVRARHFCYADMRMNKLDELCENLADALLLTKSIEIITSDHHKREHRLIAELGDTHPTIGGSKIPAGGWGNIPVGETFILPKPRRAQGSVVVDGSLPGHVMSNGENVILSIVGGKITKIEGSSGSVEQKAISLFFKDGKIEIPKTQNAHVLCEIGFGTNARIKKCHGSPVFDEKIFGSVHVAFGRNTQLGGKVTAKTHHDLVTMRPTVFFTNGTKKNRILSSGRYTVPESLLAPDWQLQPASKGMREQLKKKSRCSFAEDGGLILEWHQSTGNNTTTRVGNIPTSILCGEVYRKIEIGMSIADLVAQFEPSREEVVRKCLSLLVHYGAIYFGRP